MDGFYLGPFYVYTWGLTAAIGVIVAVWLAEKKAVFPPSAEGESPQEKGVVTPSQFWNLTTILVFAAFFGARVFYILETWDYYAADPGAVYRLWEGGFSFFGGAIGAILAGYLWSKLNKIDFLYLGWIFTPAWLFGIFFGRVGCSIIHDHLGKASDLPWGIFIQGAYRHEPALYEAVWLFLVGIGLFIIGKKVLNPKSQSPMSNKILNSKSQLGFSHWDFIGNWKLGFGYLPNTILLPLSLLLYSVGRFFIDFLRATDDRFYSLTLAQWACILTVVWVANVLTKKQGPSGKSARTHSKKLVSCAYSTRERK